MRSDPTDLVKNRTSEALTQCWAGNARELSLSGERRLFRWPIGVKSLKALRESKRIRLRRISNETRIGMAYLEDLETERFDRFPGKFYFESFTKEYARSLGLDPTEVLTDLQASYREWQGDSSDPASNEAAAAMEDGLLNRIAGYIRRAQEV